MSFSPQACVQMFEAHPDAHWLLDDRGALKHANKAALRLMGNLSSVPVGKAIVHLVADGPSHCGDFLRQGLRSTVPTPARLRLRTGEVTEVTCRCEIALLSPASTGGPALLWCRLVEHGLGRNQFALLNQQIQTLKVEIARRQAAEADMRRQSEWLETVLQGIAEGVIATDLDGTVLFMNQVAAELTGWPRALSMGRMINEVIQLFSVDSSGAERKEFAKIHLLQGDPSRRLQLVGRSGKACMVQISTSALTSESGVSRGKVFVLRSIEHQLCWRRWNIDQLCRLNFDQGLRLPPQEVSCG